MTEMGSQSLDIKKGIVDKWQVIDPLYFSFYSGSGRNPWHVINEAKLDIDVKQRMSHAVWMNWNDYQLSWFIPPKKRGTIVTKNSYNAIADVTGFCPKGKWGWTAGLTYLEAYLQAIKHVHNNGVKSFRLYNYSKDIVKYNSKAADIKAVPKTWSSPLLEFEIDLLKLSIPFMGDIFNIDNPTLASIIYNTSNSYFNEKLLNNTPISSRLSYSIRQNTIYYRKFRTAIPRRILVVSIEGSTVKETHVWE